MYNGGQKISLVFAFSDLIHDMIFKVGMHTWPPNLNQVGEGVRVQGDAKLVIIFYGISHDY